MTTLIQSVQPVPMERAVRKVVVVSNHSHQHVLETAPYVGHFDVVFVESVARAYSQIKRVTPSLVIMCLSIEDLDGVLVLSMLKLDRETCRIPVVIYTTTRSSGFGDELADANEGVSGENLVVSLH